MKIELTDWDKQLGVTEGAVKSALVTAYVTEERVMFNNEPPVVHSAALRNIGREDSSAQSIAWLGN